MNDVEFVSWRRDRRWTGWHLCFLKTEETLCTRFFDHVSLVNREQEASTCCKQCCRVVSQILVAETRKIIQTPTQGESSMTTSVTTVSQPVSAPLEQKYFRMSRTFKAFNRTRNDIDRLIQIGDKDRHAAVQAALHVLAAELCQKIGLTDAASNIHQRYRMELIPAAIKATEPLVRGVGRKARALPSALDEATREAPAPEKPKRMGIKDYKGKLPKVVSKWMRKKHPRGRPPKEVSEWVRKNLVAA